MVVDRNNFSRMLPPCLVDKGKIETLRFDFRTRQIVGGVREYNAFDLVDYMYLSAIYGNYDTSNFWAISSNETF